MSTVRSEAEEVALQLEIVAQLCESSFDPTFTGPPAPYRYATWLGSCRVTLRTPPRPDLVRARAEKLRKRARQPVTTDAYPELRDTLYFKSTKRARYQKSVAQRFVDDGELENARAYCELYGVTRPGLRPRQRSPST